MNELLELAKEAAIEGGKEILEVYHSADFVVEMKSDDSPLTIADKKAHLKIMEFLSKTDIPVLSEEGVAIEYTDRKEWSKLWIVDPLDGTKEFIKRNGEFTVNIALIEDGKPIMGVIYVPVKDILYFGDIKNGAFKVENNQSVQLPQENSSSIYKIVGSRSHMSEETESYVNELREKHSEVEMVSMGSSLKICLVAEGSANEYPRFAPTMEWDTAAGHAIVSSAGKTLIDWETKKEMKYNRENLLNNWFLVQSKVAI